MISVVLDSSAHVGVISKLADDTSEDINGIIKVIDENYEEGGAKHRPLRNARLNFPPLRELPIQDNTLLAISEPCFNPGEDLPVDAMCLKLDGQPPVRHFIKGLGKIEIDNVYGVAIIHKLGQYLEVLQQIREAGLPVHEAMLPCLNEHVRF